MLNVKEVQKNLSKHYIDILKYIKNPKNPSWSEEDMISGCFAYRSWECLPHTCSTIEIENSNADPNRIATCIAESLRGGERMIITCFVDKKKIPMFEKFGFKPFTTYEGRHDKPVYVYYLNLDGFVF